MEETNWYYNDNGRPTGPMNLADLRQLFSDGRLHATTLVWHSTLVQWMAASQVPGLLPPVPPAPPPSFAGVFHPPFAMHPQQSHHAMAVTAFVLSIVGVCLPCVGCLLGIAGLILGIIALSGMSRSNNRDGHGLAVAAVVLGALACVCHCGLLFGLGPPGNWHYEFHRNIPWRGWNV